MAIRSPKHIRSQVTMSRGPGHDVRDAVSYHGSAILALTVFVLLTSFGFALWMLKIWVIERQLAIGLEVVASKVLSEGEKKDAGFPAEMKRETLEGRNTAVSGLFIDWKNCEPGYAGSCDDYVLYRRTDTGEKVVILSSVRALFPGAYLAYPDLNSHDSRYLAMSPRTNYDGVSPEIQNVYLVDTLTGGVRKITQPILVGAMYSADNLYAAYVKESKGDYREVVVVSLLDDESKSVAKAKSNETFWDGTIQPMVKSVDGESTTFNVYTSSDATHALPELKEMRTVKFSF